MNTGRAAHLADVATKGYLGVVFVICILTTSEAGVRVPYHVVVSGRNNRGEHELVGIDLNSGLQTILPNDLGVGGLIATDSNGSLFGLCCAEDSFVDGNLVSHWSRLGVARLDFGTQQWEVTDVEGAYDPVKRDMAITSRGSLLYTGEFFVYELDREAETIRTPDGLNGVGLRNYGEIGVDSLGDVVFTAYAPSDGPSKGIFRYEDGADRPERIQTDPELRVKEFALESDKSLIALATVDSESERNDDVKVVRVDLSSGASEIVYDSDMLPRYGRVSVDPAGKVLISNYIGVGESPRILRVDLTTGAEEVFNLPDGFEIYDMKVLAVPLVAGDADQDYDFDQFDLIRVQRSAKYLSGNLATWGEGDWDGGPGGTVGFPPTGDGLFDESDIMAALQTGLYKTGPYAAMNNGGVSGDGRPSITYDPATGEVGIDMAAETRLTSVHIGSAAGIFTGDPAVNLGGSFDRHSDHSIFKATFGSSFGSLTFGNVAQAGLSQDFVASDLSAIGSLAAGGSLGEVDLVYVPEPSAMVLLFAALVVVVTVGRQHRPASECRR